MAGDCVDGPACVDVAVVLSVSGCMGALDGMARIGRGDNGEVVMVNASSSTTGMAGECSTAAWRLGTSGNAFTSEGGRGGFGAVWTTL
jgi:hypothetical protein